MKKFIKQGLTYTLVRYIVLVLGFLKSIVIAKYLGPSLLGSYAYIMLILEYLNYYNLGLFTSMNREASIYIGERNKKDYIEKIINVSLTFSLLFSLPILLIFIGLDKLPIRIISQDIYQFRFEIFLLLILRMLNSFFVQYFRVFEKYYFLNIFQLITNITMILGIILFANKYFLTAAVYTGIFANVFVLIIGFTNIKNVKYEWDLKKLKYLLEVGILLLVYGFSMQIFTTVDRLMIAQFLSRSDLGYFQFGNTMAMTVIMIVDAITFVFYPKFLKLFHYNTKKELVEKKKNLIQTIYFMEYCSTILVAIGIVIVPIFITFIMPQYLNSIIITKILLIGFTFKPLIFLTATFLIANNKQSKLIPIVLTALFFLVFINYIIISFGYGINGVAVATALALSIYFLVLYLIIFRKDNSLILLWRFYAFFVVGFLIILSGIPIYLVLFLWASLYLTRTKKIMYIVRVNF